MNNQAPVNSTPTTWPLTFDSFSFGTRAYNTLRCNIIFENRQFALDDEIDGPSGEPNTPNWRDRWSASFIVLPEDMPPGPVQLRWVSLDGVEHRTEIDLIKDIFPKREILHDVAREDVWEFWDSDSSGHSPEILLELNDREIVVYMKSFIHTRIWEGEGDDARRKVHFKLFQAWKQTY